MHPTSSVHPCGFTMGHAGLPSGDGAGTSTRPTHPTCSAATSSGLGGATPPGQSVVMPRHHARVHGEAPRGWRSSPAASGREREDAHGATRACSRGNRVGLVHAHRGAHEWIPRGGQGNTAGWRGNTAGWAGEHRGVGRGTPWGGQGNTVGRAREHRGVCHGTRWCLRGNAVVLAMEPGGACHGTRWCLPWNPVVLAMEPGGACHGARWCLRGSTAVLLTVRARCRRAARVPRRTAAGPGPPRRPAPSGASHRGGGRASTRDRCARSGSRRRRRAP